MTSLRCQRLALHAIFLLAASLFCLPAAHADAPARIPVQGVLHTPAEGPVADGDYVLKVSLYDGPAVDAALLYTEVHLAVQVVHGFFAIEVGGENELKPLTNTLFLANAGVWIAVQVGADPPLTRQRVAHVPYAIRASHADMATSAEVAKSADTAKSAETAASADTAKVAQTALSADSAKNADSAKFAMGLQCAGCVGFDEMSDAALSAGQHTALYGGQVANVQKALDGLNARVAAFEEAISLKEKQVGLGLQNPACAVDVGSLCWQGQSARVVVQVADDAAMQALGGVGQLVYRQDAKAFFGFDGAFWRQLRYMPFCGDGIVEGEEACDDGAKNGDSPDACRATCVKAKCGDKVVDSGEACDDGNLVNEDICTNICKGNTCGDGWVLPGVEECDDGNPIHTDGCAAACKKNICGDGYVFAGVEECDDGNLNPGDGCDASCKSELPAWPECQNYQTISDANRNINAGGGSACDSGIGNKWFRFTGAAGVMLPTVAPPKDRCGTQATGWMQGSHPSVQDGKVARKACFHWGGNTCNWNSSIQVINCGEYYVYNLTNSPVCNLRYCATN
mgnify:CR=1 FL=1